MEKIVYEDSDFIIGQVLSGVKLGVNGPPHPNSFNVYKKRKGRKRFYKSAYSIEKALSHAK